MKNEVECLQKILTLMNHCNNSYHDSFLISNFVYTRRVAQRKSILCRHLKLLYHKKFHISTK